MFNIIPSMFSWILKQLKLNLIKFLMKNFFKDILKWHRNFQTYSHNKHESAWIKILFIWFFYIQMRYVNLKILYERKFSINLIINIITERIATVS